MTAPTRRAQVERCRSIQRDEVEFGNVENASALAALIGIAERYDQIRLTVEHMPCSRASGCADCTNRFRDEVEALVAEQDELDRRALSGEEP